MKKLLFLGLLFIAFQSINAQSYFGKSYKETLVVDEFYDAADVKYPYSVMGKAELKKGFRSLEKCQRKIIDLAKEKGADGVIFILDEELYATTNSSGGTAKNKKDKITTNGSNTTVDLKQKIIRGTFIKYELLED